MERRNAKGSYAKDAGALGALLAGVCILCGDVVFRFRVFSGPDLVNYFIPTAHFAAPWLRRGVLPLWNPMIFCGWPLVGDAQLRWLFPPNLLLLAADPARAFSALVVGYVAFGAVGMWAYLRRAGRLGRWASVCGAASFVLAGFFASHLMSGIVVFPATAAWVPWLLLLGWNLGRKPRAAGRIALFAAAAGAQILSGAPQIVFYTWIALGLQAIWRAAAALWGTRRLPAERSQQFGQPAGIIVSFALGLAIAGAAAGSSLVPTAEFGALSLQRGGKARWDYVTDCSIAPRYLWLWVAPKFFGDPHKEETYWGGREGYWEICGYAGIGPLVGLLVALVAWRGIFGRKETGGGTSAEKERTGAGPEGSFAAFHILLAGVAVLLALGRYNPAFRLLYDWVPGFDRFRVPGRWLLFWEFGIAVVFAMVLDALLERKNPVPKPSGAAIWTALGFALFLAFAASQSTSLMRAAGIGRYRPDFNPSTGRMLDLQWWRWTSGSLWRAAAFAFGWFAVFLAAAKLKNPAVRKRLVLLAVALALADVLSFGRTMPTTRTRRGQVEEFFPRSELIAFLERNLGGHRFLATDDVHAWYNDQNQPELWADRAMTADLRDAGGYYPLCLRWYGRFINAMSHRPPNYPMGSILSIGERPMAGLLLLLDVRFLLSYSNLRDRSLRLARDMDFGLKIYEVTASRGSAFLARSRPTEGMDENEEIALLTAPDFDPERWALVSAPRPQSLEPPPERGALGKAVLQRLSPNRIRLDIERGAGDVVVVSEAYHPGWRAASGGKILKVVRADYALLGVYAPAGQSEIELRFAPASFRIGLYISCLGWSIVVALFVAGRSRPPRRKNRIGNEIARDANENRSAEP